MNAEEEHIQDILRRLSRNFQGRLIFAGVIDERAKLNHFQKGEVIFRLTTNRQAALDVQIAFVSDLARQFEDIAGSMHHVVMTHKECEVIIMRTSARSTLYVICTRGSSADITDMLMNLVEEPSETSPKSVNHNEDFVEHEWTGQ